MSFAGSYIWRLRQRIGRELVVTPGATILAFDADGRVLLIHRADTGDWALPGGATEPGSTFTSTAAEELLEETGLVAGELVAFGCISEPEFTRFTFPNGDEVDAFNLCFHARSWTGAPRSDADENVAVGFFAPEALPEPLLPMTRRVLELWEAYVASGTFQAA